MSNRDKIALMVTNIMERSRSYNGGSICYPFVVGWLESSMTNILEYGKSIDSELEKSEVKKLD